LGGSGLSVGLCLVDARTPSKVSYNPLMSPIVIASTGLLIVVFVVLFVGACRISQGRAQVRPFLERASIAVVFGLVGWQALMWLRVDHSAASRLRVLSVWAQLLCSFGISGLLLLYGRLAPRDLQTT
jgi:hypothetical protein